MLRKILVPTDGSDNAQKAVEVAIDFTRNNADPGVEISVIYVFPEIPPRKFFDVNWVPVVDLTEEDYQKIFAHETQKHSEKAIEAFRTAGLEVQTIFPTGDPGAEIVKCAEEQSFDLIIMGTRGATGFNAWVPGSVAQKVISRAPCPVLLVR